MLTAILAFAVVAPIAAIVADRIAWRATVADAKAREDANVAAYNRRMAEKAAALAADRAMLERARARLVTSRARRVAAGF